MTDIYNKAVGYWDFSNLETSNILTPVNLTGNNNILTILGKIESANTNEFDIRKSLTLDTSAKYYHSRNIFTNGENVTLSTFFMLGSNSTATTNHYTGHIITLRNNDSSALSVGVTVMQGNRLGIGYYITTHVSVLSDIVLDLNKWYIITLRKTGTLLELFCNGEKVLETTLPSARSYNTVTSYYTGNGAVGGYNFIRTYSKIALFEESLSDNEIEKLSLAIRNKTLILHDGEYKKWNENLKRYVSAIPTLTSDIGENGEAIAISVFNGYPIWQAFDNNDATNWAQATSGGGWIGYKFNNPTVIRKYEMIAQRSKTWNFEGSNDNINWDTLHTVSLSIAILTPQSFEINNTKPYLYYRVNTLTTFEYGTNMHTLKMFTYIEQGENKWSTVSSTLPTSTQFLEQGMNNLSRNITELEPMPMIDKSEILEVDETGKVFSKTIDLKKYFDIRSMKVEVK